MSASTSPGNATISLNTQTLDRAAKSHGWLSWWLAVVLLLSSGLLAAHDVFDHDPSEHCTQCLHADRDEAPPPAAQPARARAVAAPRAAMSVQHVFLATSPNAAQPRAPPSCS